MRIGIDFGTSYSAAGALVDGSVELVRFGDEHQFRTTVYFPQRLPIGERFEVTPELERQAASLVRSSQDFEREQIERARAAYDQAMKLSGQNRIDALAMVPTPQRRLPQQHYDSAIAAIRRNWLAEQERKAREEAVDLRSALYGDEAVGAYLANGGTGHLIVSPKSMLGYSLAGGARQTLLGIATHILRHIRETACAHFGTNVRKALLGRPVKFRSSRGDAGSLQAVEILSDAAFAAGFESVDFLAEPAAAAIEYHRSAPKPTRTLVVDIGGGTTDLALGLVGGESVHPTMLRSWGEPCGGTDVDIELSMRSLMPLFGKGITDTPSHFFYEACAVHDVERQWSFLTSSFEDLEAPYRERMRELQQSGHTVRLNRAVERAKIRLSSKEAVTLRLDYIEEGLRAPIDRVDLGEAASRFVHALRNLLRHASTEMDDPPEAVYLTGGMSRSPYLQTLASETFPDARIVAGDASLGVVTGLALASADSELRR